MRPWGSFAVIGSLLFMGSPAFAQTGKPVALECESLVTPLGMDAIHPQLSWKLQDSRDGAKQTAYELQVASSLALLSGAKPEVWDSGRIVSDKSIGVAYGGPTLKPSTRYYWRVLAWDRNGKPYPASDPSWWET